MAVHPHEDDGNYPPSSSIALARPGYSKLSEVLRKRTPSSVLCRTFCGGRKCRYDRADCWNKEDMAVDGLFSHWITEDVLAMARPSTEIIQSKNITEQFIKLGIKSVINLQTTGEHSFCGPPLTSSGFTYSPEEFMEKNIYYYNFGWKDYSQGTIEGLLDAVKVMSFALSQGRVAVHCHAGLGRTGVLISCYLIHNRQMNAGEAIRYIRQKRENSIQTSGQITFIHEFEQSLMTFSGVFSYSQEDLNAISRSKVDSFTLAQHLKDQRGMMHGYERRALRSIPKIVYTICERLLILCRQGDLHNADQLNYGMDENRLPFARSFYCSRFDSENGYHLRSSWTNPDINEALSRIEEEAKIKESVPVPEEFDPKDNNEPKYKHIHTQTEKVTLKQVIHSLLTNKSAEELFTHPGVREYSLELDYRASTWMKLSSEEEPEVLVALLWHWLLHLNQPVLTNKELSLVVVHADQPDTSFSRFDQDIRYTLEYLLRFIQRLHPENTDMQQTLLRRLGSVLTQQAVLIEDIAFPNDRKRLGRGTLDKLMHFMTLSLELFHHHDQHWDGSTK